MHARLQREFQDPPHFVTTPTTDLGRHRLVVGPGVICDVVPVTREARLPCDGRPGWHLLIAQEGAGRCHGGVPAGSSDAKARRLDRRLSFIPAGHRVQGWSGPSVPGCAVLFHIDPACPLIDPALRFAEARFEPRLYFFDRDLWGSAMKLKAQVENGGAGGRQYVEAVVVTLAHELLRVYAAPPPDVSVRGGLAAWQQRRVADHIETHLSRDIPLATLAAIAQLSTYHFSRAFKRSFGMPPHRYHVSRRIERAKSLLAGSDEPVTSIAFAVGFAEAGSLTNAFRRFTGRTPMDYRRDPLCGSPCLGLVGAEPSKARRAAGVRR